MQRTFLGFLPVISRCLLPVPASRKSFEGACRFFFLAIAASLSVPNVHAQAVWTNADDRDFIAGPPAQTLPYWSYGFVAPDQNGNGGHIGNWSGNLAPGKGGPADAYLGAPGDTLCDVNVTLNSLTIASGGALTMDFGSSLAVATTNITSAGTMVLGGGGGAFPSYTNTGTMTVAAGTGTYTIAGDITLDSTPGSTIAVTSGTLQLPGQNGLFDTVTFTPAAGATINLVGQGASSTFVNLFQGTLTNGTETGTVLLSQGTMAGTQRSSVTTPLPCALAFTGSVFQWTGGVIGSYQQGAIFTNTGVVNVVGDHSPTIYATFTNAGQMIETGAGGLVLGNANSGGSLTNAAGAVLDLQSDAGIGTGGGNGNFLTNAGLLKKSGGTGTSTVTAGLTFNNTGGTIEVDSGTLQLSGNGSSASTGGTFNVPTVGAVLDLLDAADRTAFTGIYTGSGAGTVRLSGGTLNSDQMNGAIFNFPGSLFQWTGGTLGGYQSGQVFTNAGTMNLSGTGDKTSYAKFTNTGTIIQTGTGNFANGFYNGGSSFTNAATGVYDLAADSGVTGDPYPFHNLGLFEKTAGTGVSTFNSELTNTGTISVYTGTLSFANNVDDISNTTLTEGAWNVFDGGTLAFKNYTGGITINQADVTLNGANANFPAINQLSDNQGSFSLLALRQFTTVGALSNEGNLVLDAGTTLHVAGTFTGSGTNSSLAITVGGTVPRARRVPAFSRSTALPRSRATSWCLSPTVLLCQPPLLR